MPHLPPPSHHHHHRAKSKESGSFDILVVGAGLSGAVIAERMASQLGLKVLLLEKRDHIGGNCFDYTDQDTGLLVSKYGLHLFHTVHRHVWEYINQFSEWTRWDHSVLGFVDGKYIPIPVNIQSVNTLFEQNISSSEEMNQWLAGVQIHPPHGITNSEEMAISRVGRPLYEKIFLPYTLKQWDKHPRDLDAEVTARIPVRDNFDNRYFTDKYQALPTRGYTAFFQKLLDHPKITVRLSTDYYDFMRDNPGFKFKKLYFTGPIDQFFNATPDQRLEYRSLKFDKEIVWNHSGYVQPASQVNYPSEAYPFTRTVEYKWFLHQKSPHSILFREYSSSDGEPYYPVPSPQNKKRFLDLQLKALLLQDYIVFVGRLANYKYFNMDEAIANALRVFEKTKPGPKPCLSYAERYEKCLWLKNNVLDSHQLADVFSSFARNESAEEVAVLRMNNMQTAWSEDFWLSVCAFITEAGGRDVILHVTLQSLPFVPAEFRSVTVVSDPALVKQAYPHFTDAQNHGDVVMAHLMKTHHRPYRFLWSLEEDCRVVGRWDEVLSSHNTDMVAWRGHLGIFSSGVFSRDTMWFHHPQFYHGRWKASLPDMVAVWTMGFGMSPRLADALLHNMAEGTYNHNQEVNLITTALEANLSVAFGDVNREWECCTLGNAQAMYEQWMQGATCLKSPFLMHAVKRP